jgi:hypothetical protein
MQCDTEFQWSGRTRGRGKFWATLLLVCAGLATGFFFVRSGRQPANETPPLVISGDEKPVRLFNAAHDEPSAIATAPPPVQVINSQAQERAIGPDQSPSPPRSEDESPAAPSYTALRRELERGIR